ncbi:MAG: ester cyclase [Acidimicrobiia bacterium]
MAVIPIDAKGRAQREATIRAVLAAQNDHRIDDVIGCFAHPRYELAGTKRVFDGADEVRQHLAASHQHFADLHLEIVDLHHAEEATVAELVMAGTHTGDWYDLAATGRRFRSRVAAVFSFEGTDLVGLRLYYDTGSIARQLAGLGAGG